MKTIVRRTALVVGVLVGVLVLAAGAGWGVSSYRLNRHFDLPSVSLTIPTDSAEVARGRHLAVAIGKCVDCHGDDFGGKVVVNDPAVGVFSGPNLTSGRGGVARKLTPESFERVVRHGVRRDGRPVVFMPAEDYQYFADADVAAIYAYMRSLPPVDRETPEMQVGPVIRALNVAGQIPLAVDVVEHTGMPAPKLAPAAGPTVDYGRYIAQVGGCIGCHGATLSGGHIPGTPPDWKPASNLTPLGIGSWSEADFTRALREGVRPNGAPIDTLMPWRLTKQMTDDEIRGLYAFLKTVPEKEFGNR